MSISRYPIAGGGSGASGESDVRKNSRALLALLPDPRRKTTLAVAASPPTVTYGTSRTITARQVRVSSASVSLLGHAITWNNSLSLSTMGALASNVGIDFVHNGTQVEFAWRCQSSASELFWIFVDGEPITAAPAAPSGVTTVAGTYYYGKLVFGSAASRRITIMVSAVNGWPAIGLDITGTITPAPRRHKIAVVGDSFMAGSAGTASQFDLPPAVLAHQLDAEVINASFGGTGYTKSGSGFTTYGAAGRISAIAAVGTPDAVVLVGSVNDDAPTGDLGAQATAAFAAYAAAFPGVPLVVVGAQPSNHTDTVSSARRTNLVAVKTAAAAASNVIAFYDTIGTAAAVPAAWSSGATYNTGDVVTHLGAVWRWIGDNAANNNSPGTHLRWEPVTWDFFGTGNSGATTSDGPRDVLLYSDGVHPTTRGSTVIGARLTAAIRQALAHYASTGIQYVPIGA